MAGGPGARPPLAKEAQARRGPKPRYGRTLGRRAFGRRRRESGAAVVELAILLLVLVPILFAALFLGDAVRFRLDVQQAVTSTAWDHAVARWDHDADGKEPDDVRPAFDAHARALLCDHSMAHHRPGGASQDCGDQVPKHHRRTLAAHLLWSDEGGGDFRDRGVRCTYDRGAARPDHPLYPVPTPGELRLRGIHDRWTFGGQVSCEATAWLYNYFVPESPFPEFTDEKLADPKKLPNLRDRFDGGAGVRRNAGQPHLSLTHRFAILADTWASDDPRDRPLAEGCRAPGEADHGVLRRVEDLWSGGDWLAKDLAFDKFVLAHNDYARKNEFIAVRWASGCREGETLATIGGAVLGADPSALVVSLRHPLRDRARPGPGKETLLRPSSLLGGSPEDVFFTAPWDVEGVAERGYSSTFANRGPYYLGCSRPGGC